MAELLANKTLEREDWPREKLLVSQRVPILGTMGRETRQLEGCWTD